MPQLNQSVYTKNMKSFKQWLEATEEELKSAEELGPHTNLKNLFKGSDRKVFKMKNTNLSELQSAVSKQTKYQFDFETGKAFKQSTDKFGNTKQQEIKITRALNEIDPNLVEKYLESELSVIITKSPIDILRMSDFPTMQSCHSKGGSYYDCVSQEIKNGGAIAYLVRTQDLNSVNLEDDREIFYNPDTKNGKIKPIARLRLRVFNEPKKNSDGIKEKIKISPVYGAISDELKNNFKDFALKTFGSLQDKYSGILQGGSYLDRDTVGKENASQQKTVAETYGKIIYDFIKKNEFLKNIIIGESLGEIEINDTWLMKWYENSSDWFKSNLKSNEYYRSKNQEIVPIIKKIFIDFLNDRIEKNYIKTRSGKYIKNHNNEQIFTINQKNIINLIDRELVKFYSSKKTLDNKNSKQKNTVIGNIRIPFKNIINDLLPLTSKLNDIIRGKSEDPKESLNQIKLSISRWKEFIQFMDTQNLVSFKDNWQSTYDKAREIGQTHSIVNLWFLSKIIQNPKILDQVKNSISIIENYSKMVEQKILNNI